jgi:hypothetical protein
VIASGQDTIEGNQARSAAQTSSASVEPGHYQLRVAALDGNGKAGVLQIPVSLELHALNELRISDLIVGSGDEIRLRPVSRVTRAAGVLAAFEIYGTDRERPDDLRALLQLYSDRRPDVILMTRELTLQCSSTRCVAQGTLDTSALSPGPYIVSAVVRTGTGLSEMVNRAIDIVR